MQDDTEGWYLVKGGESLLLFNKHHRVVERPLSEASSAELRNILGKKNWAPITSGQLAASGISGELAPRADTWAASPAARINAFRVVLTEGCDYGCTYCFEGELHKRPRTMDEATLHAVLDKLLDVSATGPITIQWFGGEPLLFFKRIREAANYLREKAPAKNYIKHVITTHGGLVNAEIADFFREFDYSVWLSMDGPEAIHDQIRKTKSGQGTHQAASRALKLMVDRGVDVGVLVTAGAHNLLTLHRLPAYFKTTFGIKSVAVNSPQPAGDKWTVDGGIFARELRKMAVAACLHGVELTSKFGKVQQLLATDTRIVSDCAAADGAMGVSIRPDGAVSPCIVEWDSIETTKFASLSTSDLQSGALVDWKLKNAAHEECRQCIAEKVCGGPCPLEAQYSKNLNVDRCRFYKTIVVEAVRSARA